MVVSLREVKKLKKIRMTIHEMVVRYYFTDMLMIILTLVTVIYSLIIKSKDLRIITTYIAISLAIDIIDAWYELFEDNRILSNQVQQTTESIFVISEISLFVLYISKIIHSKNRRIVLKSVWVIYLMVFFTFRLVNPAFAIKAELETLESFILLVAALLYLYELFQATQINNIRKMRSFWIVTGILFYAAGSIPPLIVERYLRYQQQSYSKALFSINYFLYCVLLVMFIKAYSCPTIEKNDSENERRIT